MEEQKKRVPVSFILRALVWVVLNFSFLYIAAFYEAHPVLEQVAYGANLFLTTSVMISIGKFILVAFYNRRHASQKVRGNFVLGINRVAAILNVVFFVIAIMIAFGIDPKEFITSMTIVAMAIVVIFREYITNMISGLLIMFSDQFSIGDHIKIGDHSGKIIDITLSNIVILNEEEAMVLIPNNLVFTAVVINKSAQFSSKLSVQFELPVAEKKDAGFLKQQLEPGLRSLPDLAPDSEIVVTIAALGKDFVKYKVELNTADSSYRRQKRIESAVLNAVLALQ
ncbi:small conductance mechanosensitive ion channel family transporter [Niabella ginsenosidivorans]|uniref:Small conductance mechanosensitive ion channel family transporter n=1 Tax=Niabella ginsenosidivorans TaxID=1176587 RepID=A0A1A9I3Q2_9BACT|nr:mechanosensitive ion channel domain-containing protein [Niabella ginsenosidivorans]ANH81322.1 small conductance mechanosensitive ion channel family transporter [Niabella ginsenosidivorans]